MSDSRIQLLRDMPVFTGLREETLSFVLDRSSEVGVFTGEYFFREGAAAESFFVIESGGADVLRDWEGHPVQIASLGPGACFGEMALVEQRSRNASVRATRDSVALEVPLDAMEALYDHDVHEFTLIQMNMSRELSRRLFHADRQLFESKLAAHIADGVRWLTR
jgi:CRP-like cAMP-binding protein